MVEHWLPHQAGHLRAHRAFDDHHGDNRLFRIKLGKKTHFSANVETGSKSRLAQDYGEQEEELGRAQFPGVVGKPLTG